MYAPVDVFPLLQVSYQIQFKVAHASTKRQSDSEKIT